MLAQDGKMRETDVADVETILRLVQSIPSKKAEPIKLWLAKVGYERMQENFAVFDFVISGRDMTKLDNLNANEHSAGLSKIIGG